MQINLDDIKVDLEKINNLKDCQVTPTRESKNTSLDNKSVKKFNEFGYQVSDTSGNKSANIETNDDIDLLNKNNINEDNSDEDDFPVEELMQSSNTNMNNIDFDQIINKFKEKNTKNGMNLNPKTNKMMFAEFEDDDYDDDRFDNVYWIGEDNDSIEEDIKNEIY